MRRQRSIGAIVVAGCLAGCAAHPAPDSAPPDAPDGFAVINDSPHRHVHFRFQCGDQSFNVGLEPQERAVFHWELVLGEGVHCHYRAYVDERLGTFVDEDGVEWHRAESSQLIGHIDIADHDGSRPVAIQEIIIPQEGSAYARVKSPRE